MTSSPRSASSPVHPRRLPLGLRRTFLLFLGLLPLALGVGGCDRGGPHRLIRLGDLLPESGGAVTVLASGVPLGDALSEVAGELDAARLTRLTLEIRGEAREAVVAWRSLGDARFEPYRRVTLPLEADGETHSYEVDLKRNPYWTGTVLALAVQAVGGEAELVELVAHPSTDHYRDIAIQGISMPSLPGLARLEIPLEGELPQRGRLRLALGLLPELDHRGVFCRFRAFVRTADGVEELWLDETLEGGDPERQGWWPVAREVRIPAGARLVLEVEATSEGRPLPEGVGFWGAPSLTLGKAPEATKNLLVVMVDTLRADALGVYGGPEAAPTEHLDRLAAGGVRFATVRTPAPWTLPSVASFMTGLQPQTHKTGVRVGGFTPTSLPETAETLAERLAAEGYVTSGLYHNIYITPAFRVHQGFDRWQSFEETDGELVDRAIAELATLGDERFFFYLHLFGPHNPYEPPRAECDEVAHALAPDAVGVRGCSADRRPGLPVPPPRDRGWVEALYRAEVTATDRALGRLFAALEATGRLEDTVVLVTSDHGEDFWEHLAQMRSLGGYRGAADHGHSFYEELLAVPAILAGPGVPSGVVVEPTVETVDFLPTLLGLLGEARPPEPGLDGRDLGPLLAGRPPGEHRTLLADNVLYGQPRWSVRRGPWKLVVPPEERTDGGSAPLPMELYHLERDPGETVNLAETEPEVVRSLLALGLAEREARRRRSLGDGTSATYLEWTHVTKLRSLGYLQ